MAESTTDSGGERNRRRNFFERHQELGFALGLVVGGAIFSLGTVFVVLAVAVGTEAPGTRFASPTDRYVVGGVGFAVFVLGNYIVYRAFKLAGW